VKPGFLSDDCAACGHPRHWYETGFLTLRHVGVCDGCPRDHRCQKFVPHPFEKWDGETVKAADQNKRAEK
jgi:hypothetical protein